VLATVSEYSFARDDTGGLGAFGQIGMGALARGGLTWFVVESIGVRAEIGADARVNLGDGVTSFGVGLDAAASLVMRI